MVSESVIRGSLLLAADQIFDEIGELFGLKMIDRPFGHGGLRGCKPI
jgi:hypothetical protein